MSVKNANLNHSSSYNSISIPTNSPNFPQPHSYNDRMSTVYDKNYWTASSPGYIPSLEMKRKSHYDVSNTLGISMRNSMRSNSLGVNKYICESLKIPESENDLLLNGIFKQQQQPNFLIFFDFFTFLCFIALAFFVLTTHEYMILNLTPEKYYFFF